MLLFMKPARWLWVVAVKEEQSADVTSSCSYAVLLEIPFPGSSVWTADSLNQGNSHKLQVTGKLSCPQSRSWNTFPGRGFFFFAESEGITDLMQMKWCGGKDTNKATPVQRMSLMAFYLLPWHHRRTQNKPLKATDIVKEVTWFICDPVSKVYLIKCLSVLCEQHRTSLLNVHSYKYKLNMLMSACFVVSELWESLEIEDVSIKTSQTCCRFYWLPHAIQFVFRSYETAGLNLSDSVKCDIVETGRLAEFPCCECPSHSVSSGGGFFSHCWVLPCNTKQH